MNDEVSLAAVCAGISALFFFEAWVKTADWRRASSPYFPRSPTQLVVAFVFVLGGCGFGFIAVSALHLPHDPKPGVDFDGSK